MSNSMPNLKISRHRLVVLGVIGVIVVFALILFLAAKLGLITPKASETAEITNTATAVYCTEGDDLATCNPSAQNYPGSAVSNTVKTTIEKENPLISTCIQLELKNRSSDKQSHQAIVLKITDRTNKIVLDKTITSDNTGTIELEVPADTQSEQPYSIVLKPKGYLARKLVATNLAQRCHAFNQDKAVVAGDFNEDNQITLPDLIAAIRAYNGLGNEATKAAYENQKPTLADLVGLIRNYNLSPKGEE